MDVQFDVLQGSNHLDNKKKFFSSKHQFKTTGISLVKEDKTVLFNSQVCTNVFILTLGNENEEG